MPQFGNWWFGDIYKDLYPQGDSSFGGVIKTMATNPSYVFVTLLTGEKLRYAIQILVPLAFLPIRRPALWLLLIPGALLTLLTTGYKPTTDIAFQYSGHWIAYIFPGAAVVLALLAARDGEGDEGVGRGVVRYRAALAAVIVGTLFSNAHWGAIPPRDVARGGFASITFGPLSQAHRDKARHLQELAALVPREAALAVSEYELPHLSTRLDCYSLRDGYDGADYILYATDSGNFGAHQAAEARASRKYHEIATRPGLVLLGKSP